MKRFVVAICLAFVLVLFPSPAHAEQGCVVDVNGVQVCGELVNLPLPEVTVTLPPVTLPPVVVTDIIKIPGPIHTQFVTLPQATATVTTRVPGQDETIYIPGPTATETVTVPGPVKTPEAIPRPTSTVTVTETPEPVIRQSGPEAAKVTPENNTFLSLPDLSVPEAVGYGALTLFALMGLIILGLWLGYILGYNDSNRREMKFLDALRDQFYSGKQR